VRKLVPDLPRTGFDEIPIREEVELERWLVDGVE
jgi:hypothetical protein